MVKTQVIAVLTAASSVAAYPHLPEMENALRDLQKRATEPPYRAPNFIIDRPNTGLPPLGFNAADQYVDVTDSGPHPFRAPRPNDKRGQCPGLNAAANHGFLPRNGIPTIADTVTGLGAAFNMAPDLALVLAVAAVGLVGDPVAQSWSIGGRYSPVLPLTTAAGILGGHNKLEGDASFGRGDAYLNGGNVNAFETDRFQRFYEMAETYGQAEAAAHSDYNTRWSILNNPYYFSGPVSSIVTTGAYNFVINFMSNHSEEVPGGTLDRETLKTFFAVSGEPGSFTHSPGQERIPLNWYRRPTTNQYNLVEVVADLAISNAAYPGILRIGGNTGTTDSFTGVDLQDLTGGVFNTESLLDGNDGACFLYQATLAAMPSAAAPVLGTVGSILGWALNLLGPDIQALGCPQLAKFDNTLFNQFPGAK